MRVQSSAMGVTQALIHLQKWIEDNNYIDDIMVNATIHDSIYLIVREDVEIIRQLNIKLIELMTVDYEGQLVANSADSEIGRSWKHLHGIKNNASLDEIQSVLEEINE